MRVLVCQNTTVGDLGTADITIAFPANSTSYELGTATCPSSHQIVQIDPYVSLGVSTQSFFNTPDAETALYAFQAGFILLFTVWIAGYGIAAIIQFLKKTI